METVSIYEGTVYQDEKTGQVYLGCTAFGLVDLNQELGKLRGQKVTVTIEAQSD